jgi:hypothetical protein
MLHNDDNFSKLLNSVKCKYIYIYILHIKMLYSFSCIVNILLKLVSFFVNTSEVECSFV